LGYEPSLERVSTLKQRSDQMQKRNPLTAALYRFVLFTLSLLFILSGFQARQELDARAILNTSAIWSGFTIFLFGSGIVLSIFGIILLIRPSFIEIFRILGTRIANIGKGYSKLFIGLISGFYISFYLLNKSFYEILLGFFPHILLLSVCSFLIIILLKNLLNKDLFIKDSIALIVLIPALLIIGENLVISISYINNIPFSNSWAEASHLYFSSAVFGRKVYGISVPMYPYNQTRYLMQSLPFLISGLPIGVHRTWQLFLDNGITLIFVFSLYKRVQVEKGIKGTLFLAFCFLWLSQIYIYYHLIVIALMIVVFYSNENWKRNIVIILISSFWAGFSRVNWIPVPGLLAAFMYFLETKNNLKNSLTGYLKKPLAYFAVGVIVGLIAQIIYISISGNNDINTHTAIFRSTLLWYRLLPNATYPLGILPGILLISGFMIIYAIKRFFLDPEINGFRKIFIAIILITFFVGGLVVSVKIGGGNNLHNMDAYCVFLLILVSNIMLGKISLDKKGLTSMGKKMSQILLIGILVTPIIWSLLFPLNINDSAMNDSGSQIVLQKMNEIINTYAKNRKILFISQRQLIALNYIKGVQMIPDFEQELLMEMVMSGDRQRLELFYQQLRSYAYEIIVAYPLNTIIVGYESSYPEENNLWVQGISRMIYNRYKTLAVFPEYGIEMLIPKINN
jgi:hypothetical protein